MKHQRPVSSTKRPQRKAASPSVVLGLMFVSLALVVLAGLLGMRSSPTRSPAKHAAVSSISEVLSLPSIQRGALDVASLNLLCAQGLNGAEHLDGQQCLSTLDTWAKHVAAETVRNLHRFKTNPQDFKNSEGYFRMLVLVTVLQQDFGVRYNPVRMSSLERLEPDSDFVADSQDLFLHGILGPRRMGTCVSMPVLYAAVGRRLGYPLKLVTAKGHLFARWDGDERFNIEGTNSGLNCFEDDYYQTWPYPMSAAEAKSGHYLKSLTPEEELGLFLSTRGQCLLHNRRLGEAREAFAQAAQLAPHWPEHAWMLARVSQGVDAIPPSPSGTSYLTQQARAEIDAHAARVEVINQQNRAMMEAQFRQMQAPRAPAHPFQTANPR